MRFSLLVRWRFPSRASRCVSTAAAPPWRLDLQRIVLVDAMRASLDVKDYSGAARRSSDLGVVGLAPGMKPAVEVLRGRLAEALGHDRDAQSNYRGAMRSPDRAAAAEAKL